MANPFGGGAEIYTHELCKALANKGADVTYFTSSFRGAVPEEHIDGVRYLRRGSELTVHLHGFMHAWKRRRTYDLVIDEYNGLGFFGFLLPRCMILIHQLYGQFWFRELGPLGLFPYLLEPLLVRAYRNRPAMTLSESTRTDLQGFGFRRVAHRHDRTGSDSRKHRPAEGARPHVGVLGAPPFDEAARRCP